MFNIKHWKFSLLFSAIILLSVVFGVQISNQIADLSFLIKEGQAADAPAVFFLGSNSPNFPQEKQRRFPGIEYRNFSKQKGVGKIVQASKQQSVSHSFQPFYVFSDKGSRKNHYIPSGFMPNGECISFNDAWHKDCQSGETCIKIVYDVNCSRRDQRWGGVYWLNPPNNWGQRRGGFNLTGAQKLTFWAKGDIGGEQIQEFTIGGINGNYPDSDIAVIGPVILSPQWKQYTIDLRGKDLSYISGGFAWTTNVAVNQRSCIFYLDEIRYE